MLSETWVAIGVGSRMVRMQWRRLDMKSAGCRLRRWGRGRHDDQHSVASAEAGCYRKSGRLQVEASITRATTPRCALVWARGAILEDLTTQPVLKN